MNSFFSFSIIGLILSLPHIGISVGYLANWGYGIQYSVTLWFNVVSIIISILGFICTLVAIILLGNNIYCKTTAATVSIDFFNVFYIGLNTIKNHHDIDFLNDIF